MCVYTTHTGLVSALKEKKRKKEKRRKRESASESYFIQKSKECFFVLDLFD